MQSFLIKEKKVHPIHLLQLNLETIHEVNQALLSEDEKTYLQTFQSEKRIKEIYGSILLKNHLFPEDEILRTVTGAPFLKKNSDTHISISHSYGQLILASSPIQIGIDIEKISAKVCRVVEKFVNEKEKSLFDLQSEIEMTQLWTFKEAMYKLANNSGINFREDIYIRQQGNLFIGEVLLSDSKWYHTEFHTFVEDDYITSFNIQPLVQK